MRDMNAALNKLIEGFEGFTEELRGMADEAPQNNGAGDGEEPYREEPDDGGDAGIAQAPARDGVNDQTVITMQSGDLRRVLNSYRKLSRYARERRIPDRQERFDLHKAIKKVKHLVRRPVH